jgi:2-amino-4-hydroxy-6-hydroxymethyldihydropteridine diphosphokinase
VRSNVYVGLGSNLGSRPEHLESALSALAQRFDVLETSSVIRTEPFEVETERAFLNQVLELDPGELGPQPLLEWCLDLERRLGRDRQSGTPDRVIDVDLLYYGNTVRHTGQLDVPHPEVHRRAFVLKSMVELNPVFLHPELCRTQVELLVKARSQTNEN